MTKPQRKPPMLRGLGQFLKAWVRQPLKMGAVAPSSRFLARAMAKMVDVHREGVVIELGAGTGVVTHALLEAGVKPENLLVIERDPRLCRILQEHFPQLTVMEIDASRLMDVLAERGVTQVNAVVSSLPLLSLPKQVRDAIVGQIGQLMKTHHAVMVQFTYGPRSSISNTQMQQWQMIGKPVARILCNLPPATVWQYKALAAV